MDFIEKSIQELENNYWPDQKNYPTALVERCHAYRKIKIKDLQIHQIITLLIQDIGADYLMPVVLRKMEENIGEEDDYDGSSFLGSIGFFSVEIFKRNRKFQKSILVLLESKRSEIEGVLGWTQYEQMYRKIEEIQ